MLSLYTDLKNDTIIGDPLFTIPLPSQYIKDDKLKDTSVEMSVKETSVADLILQELGVKSAIHRLKIKTKFEGFYNKSLSTQSRTKLK